MATKLTKLLCVQFFSMITHLFCMEASQSSVVEEGNNFFVSLCILVFYKFLHRGYNSLSMHYALETYIG